MLSLGNKLTLNTQPIYHFVNKYSIDFDGVDDCIVTDGADTVAQPTTYSFWCKSSSTASNLGVFGHGDEKQGGFHFNFLQGGTYKPLLWLGNSYYVFFNDISQQDDGEWHHWVVYSDTNNLNNCKLYCDGVLQTVASTVTSGSLMAYTESLTIGSDQAVGGNSFEGKIDEFAVYDRELTQAEITRMYNTYYSPNRVANGNFSQVGNEEVTNGDFSQIGSEEITNGDFATDSDWTKHTGITISNGKANFNNVASGGRLQQNFSFTNGKAYKIVVVLSSLTSGRLGIFMGGTYMDMNLTAEGTYTYYHTPTSGTEFFFRVMDSGTTASIDNVSVKEVGQYWGFFNGSSMGDNAAAIVGDGSAFGYIQQVNVFEVGKFYKITTDVTINSGLGLKFQDGASNENFGFATTSGSYTFYGKANNAHITIGRRTGGTAYDSSVNSISVKEVGQHWTFGTGWSTDGTKAISDGTDGGVSGWLRQYNVLQNGKNYKATFDVDTSDSGTVLTFVDGNALIQNIAGSGSKTINFTSAGSEVSFTEVLGKTASITNIVVQELKHDATNLMLNHSEYQSANPLITSTKSMEFDGSDDYLQLSEPFNYTNHTICGWAYSGVTNANNIIFSASDSASDGIRLMFRSSSNFRYRINGINIDTAANTREANRWYFVCGTYDGTTARIYIDGVELTNSTTSQTISTPDTSARIGSNSYAQSSFFDGKITEVGAFNRCLTSLEVASLYNQGMPTNLLVNRNNYQSGNPTVFNTKQVDFDGTDDYLDLGTQSATSSLTYSAWVKVTDTDASTILSYGNTILRLGNNTTINWWSDNNAAQLNTTVSSMTNVWSHIVVTQTGQNAIVYLNGVQVNSSTSHAVVNISPQISSIGRYAVSNLWYFTGEISQVGIWNEALTANEVSSLYNHGLPIDLTTDQAAYESSSNLVGYWRMGSGTLDTYPLIADQTNATLGSELVTDGNFPTGTTAWGTGGEWVISGGVASTVGTTKGAVSQNCLIYGLNKLTFTLISGEVSVYTQYPSFGVRNSYTVADTYTIYLYAQTNPALYFYNKNAGTPASISNVSVKQVNGNPAIMTNQTSSDIENGSPYANLVQNSDFSEGSTDWTITSDWTLGTNKVTFDDTTTNYIAQNSPSIVNGKSYKMQFTVLDCPSTANIQIYNRSHNTIFIANENWSNGTYTRYFTSTVDSSGYAIWGNTNLDTFALTNITISEVNTGLQGYWKMGDGTNDEYPVIYDQTNPTLGSELVTDGNFPTGTTAWYLDAIVTISNNEAIITGNGIVSSGQFYQTVLNIEAGSYLFTFDYNNVSGNTIRVNADGTLKIVTTVLGDTGTYTAIFTPSTSNPVIRFYGYVDNGEIVKISNVSFKKLNGNAAYMTNMVEGNITNQYPLTKIRNYYRMGDGILDGYPIIQDQTSPNLAHIPTTNLITYSEDFSQSYWIKAGITETDNYAIAPDGTQTAARLIIANADPYLHNQTADLSVVAGTTYTFSYYEKGVGNTIGKTSRAFIWYLGTATGSANLTNFTLTGDWERREISFTPTGSGTVSVRVDTVNASIVVGEETLIWGFQLEAQSQATAYIKSDGIAAVRKSSTTNLITYSEDFSGYNQVTGSITANSTTSPDGTLNASVFNALVGLANFYTRFTATVGLSYAQSIFLKKGTRNWVTFVKSAGSGFAAWFDLENGVIGTVASGFSANMENYGNGWYRCSVISNATITLPYFQVVVVDDNNATTNSVAGSIFIWGVQAEQQTQAETYAKTTGLPVTIDLFTENNYGTMTNMSASDIIEDTPNN